MCLLTHVCLCFAGSELITYQPQEMDISDLFDIGDISSHHQPSAGGDYGHGPAAAVYDQDLIDLNASLNTPLIDYGDGSNPMLLNLSDTGTGQQYKSAEVD